jgi:hypothetical protein
MNSLRTFYSSFTPFHVQSLKRWKSDDGPRGGAEKNTMLLILVLTVLCITGTAFYLRFLYALFREFKPRSTNGRGRKPPRLRLQKLSVRSAEPSKSHFRPAALQITEMPGDATFITWGGIASDVDP